MKSDKPSRRKLLQSSGLALTGLFSLGAGAAAAHDESDAGKDKQNKNDQPFNPDSTAEVINWVQKHLRGPQPNAKEKLQALTREQAKAVRKVTEVRRVKVTETVTTNDGDADTQGDLPYQSKTVTRAISGKAAVGKVWTFTHEVYFEYNGADDVKNISSNSWGNTHFYTWFYKGSTGSSQDKGDSFDSFEQGTFDHCITELGCFEQENPWIEISGNYTGSVSTDYYQM